MQGALTQVGARLAERAERQGVPREAVERLLAGALPGGLSGKRDESDAPKTPPREVASEAGAEHASACRPCCARGRCGEGDDASWLGRARQSWLWHLDAAYPPCFVGLASVLFWSNALGFFWALALLPLLFVAGVQLLVLRLAARPARSLPQSRLVLSLVVSLEAATFAVFAARFLPLLSVLWVRCGLFFALGAGVFALHWHCAAADPGVLTKEVPEAGTGLTLRERALEVDPELRRRHPAWCFACQAYRPIRSKHCAACAACVDEQDHHCPVLASCVGRSNRRPFFAYLACLAGAELCWYHLFYRFLERLLAARRLVAAHHDAEASPGILIARDQPFTALASLRALRLLPSLAPGTAVMALVLLPVTAATLFLLARMLWGILANLTVHEMLRRPPLPYLLSADGLYDNPWDRGVAANCARFWTADQPDAYEEYARRDQRPHVAGKAGLPWGVRTLRAWRDALEKLRAAREARRLRREAALLQEYRDLGKAVVV